MYSIVVRVHRVITFKVSLEPCTAPLPSHLPASSPLLQVVMYGTSVDMHQVIEEDPMIAKCTSHCVCRVLEPYTAFLHPLPCLPACPLPPPSPH